MDPDQDEHFDDPDQFVRRIKDIVATPCEEYEEIDNVLRAFLNAVTSFHKDHEDEAHLVQDGCIELLTAGLFEQHRQYIRRQFIESLLQEDEYPTLEVMTTFLLFDGRSDEDTFVMMQEEGLFARLVELIKKGNYEDTDVHRMLLELLCEMTRISKLSRDDLQMVDDAFILYLFQLVERMSADPSEPYHNAIIRLLLILNEQYMCFSQDQNINGQTSQNTDPLPNRIIKILSTYGPAYRCFGENLILLLNRQSELGPQLLILKILYLLFTNAPTYEYFYTNDLHVLVDVIMRNLLDLDFGIEDEDDSPVSASASAPEGLGQRALRHTYLRVLYPLLQNTQVGREGGSYKRDQLRRTLRLLASSSSQHFAPAEQTVVRLVTRCIQIAWLRDDDDGSPPPDEEVRSPIAAVGGGGPTDADVARRILLGMSSAEAGVSSFSVLDVTAKVEKEERKQQLRERPLVPPRRRGTKKKNDAAGELLSPSAGTAPAVAVRLKVKPSLPKPRRAKSEQVRDGSPFADGGDE